MSPSDFPNGDPSLSPLDHRDTAGVEKAAMDLRRGLPVVFLGEPQTEDLVLAAVETLTDPVLAWLQSLGDVRLVLSHTRAKTLKMRLYTEGGVCLPVGPADRVEALRRIADPALDLSAPLSGPFQGIRDAPDWPWTEILKLPKIAGLLPAALALRLDPQSDTGAPMTAGNWAFAQRIAVTAAAPIRAYDVSIAESLHIVSAAQVPLADAPETRMMAFRGMGGGPEHYALVIGDPSTADAPLVRLHSECFTGDLLGSLKCDCGEQLRGAVRRIAEEGCGVLLYLAQEGRGIGLMNKLRAYALQDQGFDTVEANERLGFEIDERAFQPAAEMLKRLNLTRIRLLTNNPAKVDGLRALGIDVAERTAHAFEANPHNADYLRVKAEKTGHSLDLEALTRGLSGRDEERGGS